MKKFELGKTALFLSLTTLITVLAWITFEIYRTAHQTTITQITQEQMKPLNPKIDTNTIEALKSDLVFEESALNFSAPEPVASPTATHEED